MLYQINKTIGISMTCYRRADYLENVLDSLFASLEYSGLDTSKTVLYISIDYYDDTIPSMIKDIDWIKTKFLINSPSIGCNANTRQAINMSLEENDATIHLEDDTVLSKDAISFYTTYLEKYHDDSKIISIAGYNKTDSLENADLSKVLEQKHFTCWGCAFGDTNLIYF
jgi:GT2 family glycosyltransferase